MIELPYPSTRYKYVAVDFDGTLCENKFPKIGIAYDDVFEWLKSQRALGSKIILWTCRSGELLDEAINFCRENGVEFDSVNENPFSDYDDSKKIFADIYLDDKAWRVEATDDI